MTPSTARRATATATATMADNRPRRVTSSCEAEMVVSRALEVQGVLHAADVGEQNGFVEVVVR